AQPLKRRWGTGRVMAVGDLVAAAALAATGLLPALWFAAAAYFVTSLAVTVWNVLVMSLRQAIIPGRLLGRVHGSWRTVLWGTMPLGSLIGGFLGRIDLAGQFLIAGGVATAVSLLAFRFLSRLPNPEDVGEERPRFDTDAGPADPSAPG